MRKKPPTVAHTPRFSSSGRSSPCGPPPSRLSSEGFPISTSDATSPRTYGSVFSLGDQNLPNPPAIGHRFPESEALGGLGSTGVCPIPKLVPFPGGYPNPSQPATVPTFSFLPTLRLPSIPRPLLAPLSLFNADRFQVSVVTTSSELDWTLCAFPRFCCRTTTRGAYLISSAVMRHYCGRDNLVFISRVPSKMLCYAETFRAPLSTRGSSTPWPGSGHISVPASETHLEWANYVRNTFGELKNCSRKSSRGAMQILRFRYWFPSLL